MADKTTRWTDKMQTVFIRLLLEQKRNGKVSDSGMKKEVWTRVVQLSNEKLNLQVTKTLLHLQLQQLQSKY